MTALRAYPFPELSSPEPGRRFERIAITSVPDDPLQARSSSQATRRIARAFRRLGISTVGITAELGLADRVSGVVRHVLDGYGLPKSGEQLRRGKLMRRRAAMRVAADASRLGIKHVLHMGTLDLPAIDIGHGVKHYLYCEHSWLSSLRFRSDVHAYNARALRECERLERQSLSGLEHVFTVGDYLSRNLIEHYGVPARRVTTVGFGMDAIQPYFGPKDYRPSRLLYIARPPVEGRDSELLSAGFLLALRRNPGLTLTIAGDARAGGFAPSHPRIFFRADAAPAELQSHYRDATLLVQPALNDPRGQVYLEALASRTPVLGLNRNGLPEIIEGGRHGFLVEDPAPEALAEAITAATSNPGRLAEMGMSGQKRALGAYSWDRVAARIACR